MKTPTNTTELLKTRAGVSTFLLSQMTGGRAIEAMEEQGQRELVHSEVLPSDVRDEDKLALESAGVVFGDLVDGDPLFRHVQLPTGWSRQATNHAMHSDLLDEKRRIRGGIFYKAASYDRKAHLSARRRYEATCDYSAPVDAVPHIVKDHDGTILYSAGVASGWQEGDALRQLTEAWLTEHFPDWKNAAAYWD